MPFQQEIQQKKNNETKKGGMSWTTKIVLILIGICIFFIVWNFAFGGITSFYQLFFFGVSFVAIIGTGFLVLYFLRIWITPAQFSPKKDYFNRLVNLAIDLKPDNVRDLYFRGDKDKKRVRAGRIVGLLGIPYFIGHLKRHEKDKFDSEKKKIANAGDPVYQYSEALRKNVPVFESVEYGEDGDSFFIYEKGFMFFAKRHYLRCHKSLHGDLNGDVDIYDINPVPYGSLFEYPYKQKQKDPARIMIQNHLEVILATQEHQLDYISQGVDSAVYFNPYFRLIEKSKVEMSEGQT